MRSGFEISLSSKGQHPVKLMSFWVLIKLMKNFASFDGLARSDF